MTPKMHAISPYPALACLLILSPACTRTQEYKCHIQTIGKDALEGNIS